MLFWPCGKPLLQLSDFRKIRVASPLQRLAAVTPVEKQFNHCFTTVPISCCCLQHLLGDGDLVSFPVEEKFNHCFTTVPISCCCLQYLLGDGDLVSFPIEEQFNHCFTMVRISCSCLQYLFCDGDPVSRPVERHCNHRLVIRVSYDGDLISLSVDVTNHVVMTTSTFGTMA